MGARDAIVKRIYVRGELINCSPCIIGNGEDSHSDIDFIRDSEGKPYIPGTSLAGVLRNHINGGSTVDTDIANALFGHRGNRASGLDSAQSSLYISDCMMEFAVEPVVRDGVALNGKTKTAIENRKYEYEMLEPGCTFTMRVELIIREKDEGKDLPYYLGYLLHEMIEGHICIGAKTNRGFGQFKIVPDKLAILQLDFSKPKQRHEDMKTWLNFDWKTFNANIVLNDLIGSRKIKYQLIPKLHVELRIPYSILVRSYNHISDEVDYKHIGYKREIVQNYVTYDGTQPIDFEMVPFVPGTTWAGALRSQSGKILDELIYQLNCLSLDEKEKLLQEMFGYVVEKGDTNRNTKDVSEHNNARRSVVMVGESEIENARYIDYTRVKIDRFTGGAVDGALFTAKPIYGGNTVLEIAFRSLNQQPVDWMIGLALLVLKDLDHGILAVGGETSIGRGIFKIVKVALSGQDIDLNANEDSITATYFCALLDKLNSLTGRKDA